MADRHHKKSKSNHLSSPHAGFNPHVASAWEEVARLSDKVSREHRKKERTQPKEPEPAPAAEISHGHHYVDTAAEISTPDKNNLYTHTVDAVLAPEEVETSKEPKPEPGPGAPVKKIEPLEAVAEAKPPRKVIPATTELKLPDKPSNTPQPAPEEAPTQIPGNSGVLYHPGSTIYPEAKTELPIAKSRYRSGKRYLRSMVASALAGISIYFLINSQLIIGQIQFLTTDVGSYSAPEITNFQGAVSVAPEPRIIIPKISVNVPVVYDEPSYDEGAIQKALQRGVVHYGQTGVPGQVGNTVIVGHSSNNWWAGGEYKFAFVLLEKLEIGDTFQANYESVRYVYEVTEKKVVDANDFSVVAPTETPVMTLITCSPPGTNWKRLVVVAKQISPDPSGLPETPEPAPRPVVPEVSEHLPGNSAGVWTRIKRLFGDPEL